MCAAHDVSVHVILRSTGQTGLQTRVNAVLFAKKQILGVASVYPVFLHFGLESRAAICEVAAEARIALGILRSIFLSRKAGVAPSGRAHRGPTGHSNEASPRYYRLSMSRIFCLARSVDVLEEVPTKGWQRSMRGLLPGNRAVCGGGPQEPLRELK
jgi:hypothetical protein